MAADRREFTIEIDWVDNLSFNVRWDLPEARDLVMDEPPDLGGSGKGPNASRMVVAGIANCLTASLLFCLQKSKVDFRSCTVRAHGEIVRNERNRLRLARVRIEPLLRMEEAEAHRLSRCMDIFEDYCIVTESIRHGIPVDVQVYVVDEGGTETPVESLLER